MIKVLLADDHQMIRDGIKTMLKGVKDISIVGEAENGKETIALSQKEQPNVILMDINMPEMTGLEAAKVILEEQPEVRILALSMHNEEDYILKMLQAGALGYILKTIGKAELVEAIQKVAVGENYFSPQVSSTLLGQFTKPKSNGPKNTKAQQVPLTSREKEILRLIAEEFTNQEIAEKLFISPRTVDTHRRNLLQKLDVKNTAGLVKYAIQTGLVE